MNKKALMDFLEESLPHIEEIQEAAKKYGITDTEHISVLVENDYASLIAFLKEGGEEKTYDCRSFGNEDFKVGSILDEDGVVTIPRTRKKGEDGKTGEDQDGEAAEAAAEGPDQGGGA